jgi:hypothetical protein
MASSPDNRRSGPLRAPHPATVVQRRLSPHSATVPVPARPPHAATVSSAGGNQSEYEVAQPALWWLGGAAVAAAATLAYVYWPSADLPWEDFIARPAQLLGDLELVPAQAFASPVLRSTRGTARIPTVHEHAFQTSRICLRRVDAPARYTIVVDHQNGSRGSRPAVYLPWASNEAHLIHLRAGADIFLTDRLNGCGMIFHGPRANSTVVHANHYTGVDDLDARYRRLSDVQQFARVNALREQEYRALAQRLGFGYHCSVFSPVDYYAAGQPARVFGVKQRAGWTFYAITRPAAAGGYVTAQIWP